MRMTNIDDTLAPMRPLKSFPTSQDGVVEAMVMFAASRNTRFEMCARSMTAQKSAIKLV